MRTLTIGLNKFCDLIPFISFEYPGSKQGIDLMIDSGSQGNVIKVDVLPRNIEINYSKRIWIKGISDKPFCTIGSVTLKIFNQAINFHVIQDILHIPYDGILGIDFLYEYGVLMDFNLKNLHFGNYTIPFKQNKGQHKNSMIDEIFNVNQLYQTQTLPLIDVLNRELTYVGQFLLDTGSEGNLIKISSLPFDCEIDNTKIVYLKGICGEAVSTLGTAQITIFGHLTNFQVVPEHFPIPCEGLLGAEYFEISHALLNFEHKFIQIGKKSSAFKERKLADHTSEEVARNNTEASRTEEDDTSVQEIETNDHQSNELEYSVYDAWDNRTSLGERHHFQNVNLETVEDLFSR